MGSHGECMGMHGAQSRNLAKQQSCNLARNKTITQSCNTTIMQPCNVTNMHATEQSRNLATQQSRNLATQQSRNLVRQQSRNLALVQAAIAVVSLGICAKVLIKIISKARWAKLQQKWNNAGKDVVVLHQFGRASFCPNPSPYPIKLETFLRINNIKYVNDFDFDEPIAFGI
jgi:hypothetical protein